MRDLTQAERKAISALLRLEKTWPKSLWLFAASGVLCIMQTDEEGNRVHLPSDGVDPSFIVETVNIPCDGGDW